MQKIVVACGGTAGGAAGGAAPAVVQKHGDVLQDTRTLMVCMMV